MVTATQPWGIRRFVPMVVPLLLTLALLGWHRGLSAAAPRLGLYLNHGYALLAAAAVAYLIRSRHPSGTTRSTPALALK